MNKEISDVMETGKIYSLEDYQNEFGVPIWVIVDALKNGISFIDKNCYGLKLRYKNGCWCLENKSEIFQLSNFGATWDLINEHEKKKTYAEIKCEDMSCDKCPIRNLDCGLRCENTLQELLDMLELDDEEREFYQKRIDKEYKEETSK